MELKGRTLYQWFIDQDTEENANAFPHGENYFIKFQNYANQLIQWVHPEVGANNAVKDKSLLTNHGPDHIKTLIERIAYFLDENEHCKLSLFEIYILLMAVHLHDVGNMFGRKGHELTAQKVLDLLGNGIVGQETLVIELIFDIAKAHKGEKIEFLGDAEYIHQLEVRPQLLAAMLKFGDELAENFSRANAVGIATKNVSEENLLYHLYAKSINSIIPIPRSREIKMIFNLYEKDLTKKYQKEDSEIYLIDEIHLRVLKTYSERIYCMKFMRPHINFDSIKVTLKIKSETGSKIELGYVLEERTILNTDDQNEAYKLCPNFEKDCGKNIHDMIVTGTLHKI